MKSQIFQRPASELVRSKELLQPTCCKLVLITVELFRTIKARQRQSLVRGAEMLTNTTKAALGRKRAPMSFCCYISPTRTQ